MALDYSGAGSGALSGAAAGATIGSVVPVIGTGIGALAGGLLGGAAGLFGGGGDDDEVSLPTAGESVNEWASILPKIWEQQQQYAPQEAAMQYGFLDQYAPQYAQLQSDIRQQQMPETFGLQEQMARQASEGLSGDLTDSERRQFLDLQKSLVGDQATSGIGTDYIGSNLLDYVQNRKAQNQNLGMGLLDRMYGNVNTSYSPSYTDYMSTFTPSTVMNYNLGGYSSTPAPQSGAGGLGSLLGGIDFSQLAGGMVGLGGSFSNMGLTGSQLSSGLSNPSGWLSYGGNRTNYPGGTGTASFS